MSKIIIYDSNCKFCTRFANWCKNKKEEFTIISVRDKDAKKVLREKGVKFIDLQTIYFVDENAVLVRSKAVFKVLSYLKYPWKIISFFSYLPVVFTDYFYKLFAKYRYYF